MGRRVAGGCGIEGHAVTRERREGVGFHEARVSRFARSRASPAGIEKILAGTPSLHLNGVEYTPATLAALFQRATDLGLAAEAARAAFIEAAAAAKLEGNAKRTATRAARHVVGPRQREKIHGDVTAVAITPVVSARVEPPPGPDGG